MADRTSRLRPMPMGCSIGNVKITAGTSGCLVRRGDEVFILSNAHVFTPDPMEETETRDIVQPGPYDGGSLPDDKIGDLTDYIAIKPEEEELSCLLARSIARFLNSVSRLLRRKSRFKVITLGKEKNKVDCAIATPLSPDIVKREILGIGVPRGTAEGKLGMNIKKSGRTTGLTTGKIRLLNATVRVQYGSKTAIFEDQLVAEIMSKGGDSGSAVLDEDNRICGLLFAGSDTMSIINKISHVEKLLRVEVA
ncbi:MAG: hypothetical protein QMC85_04645 [Methanocellales archaeon]|nr:hypothetical protein [Methanocellales archaeon]